MIPKIIHYVWFGGGSYDSVIEKCIKSWSIYLSDYEIKKWDESNFDIESANLFVQEAYRNKKWAFVSDYVRAWALYYFGGIYLDTDVEIRNSLNSFLDHKAFSGFEDEGIAFCAVWGCEQYHIWPKLVLEYYNSKTVFSTKTNTSIVTKLLETEFGINSNTDKYQTGSNGVVIYPSYYFTLDVQKMIIFKNHYACHHFNTSWTDEKDIDYGKKIRHKYEIREALKLLSEQELLTNVIQNIIEKQQINEVIRQAGIKKVLLEAIKVLFNHKQ